MIFTEKIHTEAVQPDPINGDHMSSFQGSRKIEPVHVNKISVMALTTASKLRQMKKS